MKLRKFGLLTGIAVGGGLIIAGLFSASLAESSSPGSGIMLVIGVFFVISGLFIAGLTLFGWTTATVFAKAGIRGRTVLLSIIALFLLVPPMIGGLALLFSTPQDLTVPLAFRYEQLPTESGSWGGAIVTMEAWSNDPDNPQFSDKLVPAGTNVTLLSYATIADRGDFTEYPITNAFPWFHVRYDEGQEGIMWGGDLCANTVWVNGLNRACDSPKATDAAMDSVENAYAMLPAVWVRGSGLFARALLHITPQSGKEANYEQSVTTYMDHHVYSGTWQVSRAKGNLRPTLDGHTPLVLTVGPSNSPASFTGTIVRLNDDWLVVELPNGQRPGYRRAADPEATLAEWQERSALKADENNL